jgi:hypothetical protein
LQKIYKYFCSITNLVDENKTLPDFDDRGGNVLESIWVREEEIIDIIFFIDIIILLLILSGPVALLLFKIEIISMISSSLTQILSSTLPPLSSKSGKVLFSSTKLVIEQKYLFKTSAFSLGERRRNH